MRCSVMRLEQSRVRKRAAERLAGLRGRAAEPGSRGRCRPPRAGSRATQGPRPTNHGYSLGQLTRPLRPYIPTMRLLPLTVSALGALLLAAPAAAQRPTARQLPKAPPEKSAPTTKPVIKQI